MSGHSGAILNSRFFDESTDSAAKEYFERVSVIGGRGSRPTLSQGGGGCDLGVCPGGLCPIA